MLAMRWLEYCSVAVAGGVLASEERERERVHHLLYSPAIHTVCTALKMDVMDWMGDINDLVVMPAQIWLGQMSASEQARCSAAETGQEWSVVYE